MRQNLRTSPERITAPTEPINQHKHWWERLWCWLFVFPLGMFLRGCLDRSILTIILALLLFLFLIWLLRDCGGYRQGFNGDPPGFQYLEPGRNPMPPVDPGKIGHGRDSITPIVLDRINVLLEKKDNQTGRRWQAEFKRLYPNPDFKIVYFDSLTYRLQLQVPDDKREYLIDNLNAQMPQFEFLLFEESVFQSNYTPSDPGFIDKRKSWYFNAIHCYTAWDITQGSDSIIVAVVDNGFDLTHPEIATKVVEPFNVPQRNHNLYPPRQSSCPGHGTHVAALAVGEINNGEGVSGIAPKCRLMPVQVTDLNGHITLTNILDGILYAIYKGANVVNVSLGVDVDPNVRFIPPSQQLQIIVGLRRNEERVWAEVFKIANNRNCTIVLAAGNEDVLSGFDAMKRNNETIVVSAVDSNLHKADFSNYGHYADLPYNFSTISAPGVEIYNACSPQKYDFLQGTSMAAPIVSGAIALMKSINPQLTTTQIIDILQNTGIPMQEPIGNFIQLDKALEATKTGNYPRQGQQGGNLGKNDEKMKTGDIIKDITQLYGLWKSNSTLLNNDGENIDLYMSFSKQMNELIIVEPSGDRYTAAIEVAVDNQNLNIRQLDYATNSIGKKYHMYNFDCTTDLQGYLQCEASEKGGSGHVTFNLIKIK